MRYRTKGTEAREAKRIRSGTLEGARWLCLVLIALLIPTAALAEEGSADTRLQHLHVLMHEGLSMVLEGADLVMISEMGMEASMDDKSSEHGRALAAAGRRFLEETGSALALLVGQVSERNLQYTQGLNAQFVEIGELLEGMEAPKAGDKSNVALHHSHMMVLHALRMAARGANLSMLAGSEIDGELGNLGRQNAGWLLANAKTTVARVVDGPSMKTLHEKGGYDEDLMKRTHELANQAREVIEAMSEMPR